MARIVPGLATRGGFVSDDAEVETLAIPAQNPIPEELNVPAMQVWNRVPSWVYPGRQPREQNEPEAITAPQEPTVMADAGFGEGCAHALGLQVPVGDEKFPAEQVMLRDPLVVYPLAHERVQDVLLGVREVLHVPDWNPCGRAGRGQGFSWHIADGSTMNVSLLQSALKLPEGV